MHPRLTTLKLFENLLKIASADTGFSTDAENMMVQVQSASGGCRIIFTCTEDDLKTTPVEPVVFSFSDINDVIDASAGLFEIHSHRIYKSSLYRMGKGYRLLVRTLDAADGPVNAHLEQYGLRTGQGEVAAAYLDEHADLIIVDEAVDRLAELSKKV